MSQQEEERPEELLVEQNVAHILVVEDEEEKKESDNVIEEQESQNEDAGLFPMLDEELDEKAMVIAHLQAIESQALKQEQISKKKEDSMMTDNEEDDEFFMAPSDQISTWTDSFDNITDFMALIAQSTWDIENRLNSQDSNRDSLFVDLQLIQAQKISFFKLLHYLDQELQKKGWTQKSLPDTLNFHIEQCAYLKNRKEMLEYNEEKREVNDLFRLYKLSLTVKWAYNQIRIEKLKKEEGIKYEDELDEVLKQPINPEEELRQQRLTGQSRTQYDRLLSLQRQIHEHHQYTVYMKQALEPSFDPEMMLNIKNFSQVFTDQMCVQRKLKSIEDLDNYISKTQEQIQELNQIVASFQQLRDQARWHELLRYLNFEQKGDNSLSVSDQQVTKNINEYEMAKIELYRANKYLRDGSLEYNIQKLIYFMRLKILKKRDEITNVDITQGINQGIEKSLKNIQDDEKIYDNYQAERILKSIKNTLIDYQNTLNLDNTIKKLQASLGQMTFFNFRQVMELSLEHQKVMFTFQNDHTPKKVVIMFGRTGLGKSTAVQYLGGETMEKIEGDLPHIGVKQFKNPLLERFKNSPYSRSETSFCSTIELEHERLKYLFCDTPGFGDTRGGEIDFANTLGIFNALENMHYSKTIIPAFFFSIDALSPGGGRGETFRKDINQLYLQIFLHEKFDQYKNEVLFFFTRGVSHNQTHEDRLSQVRSYIEDIRRNDKYNVAPEYVLFVKQILENENRVFVIDPLDGTLIKPIFKALKHMVGIDKPSETFQFSEHYETSRKVQEQLQFNNQLIKNSIALCKYDIPLHYLQEIKEFQTKVKKLEGADIYLKTAVPLLEAQRDEFFNLFSRILQFSIRRVDAEDLTRLEFLLNRLRAQELLKDEVEIVMSQKDIELKIADIVQKIYISEVAQVAIDDEKWSIIIDKTRILSETPFMVFLNDKHLAIYEDFLSKVRGCITELRKAIGEEIEIYFNRQEEEKKKEQTLNSASLYSKIKNACALLLEPDSNKEQSTLQSIIENASKQIKIKVGNETCNFEVFSINAGNAMLRAQLKNIKQEQLDQVSKVIAALSIFDESYSNITDDFTKIKDYTITNIKKYLENLIRQSIVMLMLPNKDELLKLLHSQISSMFSTFSFVSNDITLRNLSASLYDGQEQLIIEARDKILHQLYDFMDNRQTQETINEVRNHLAIIQQMRLVIGEQQWANTIEDVKERVTKQIAIVIEHMQQDIKDVKIKLIKEDQEQMEKVIITQYWYRQLQSAFSKTFPDWIPGFNFPEALYKTQILEIFDTFTAFVTDKQLIEEQHPITSDTIMITIQDYCHMNHIQHFIEFLESKEVYLRGAIENLKDKTMRARNYIQAVTIGQNKVIYLAIKDHFSKIVRVLQDTSNLQTLITKDDLTLLEVSVEQVIKVLNLLSSVKIRHPATYESLTNDVNDYNLLQALDQEIGACLQGDAKFRGGMNLLDRFHLASFLSLGTKEMDLIKLNNGSLIAEKLVDMDLLVKKVLDRRYSQLQFGEIRNKFLGKYELYQQVQTKSQQIMGRESQIVDLEKNYQDVKNWLKQLDHLIKNKNVMRGDVQREQEAYLSIINATLKAQQYHIIEIERYLRFDDQVFEVTSITRVKQHVIKLYKMSKYLDPKFISKSVNIFGCLKEFRNQMTKKIQQQKDIIMRIVFTHRNLDDGLKKIEKMIISLEELDMSYDDVNLQHPDHQNPDRLSNLNSVASLSLRVVASAALSTFSNPHHNENSHRMLQGVFPYQGEFKAIQDRINEEIQTLLTQLNKRDQHFYSLVQKHEVGKIIDNSQNLNTSLIHIGNLQFLVKEIGKIVTKKVFIDLEEIEHEKYSVEDDDACELIIKQQNEKLNVLKNLRNHLPTSIKNEVAQKIEQVSTHIKIMQQKLIEEGLKQLQSFANESSLNQNKAFQDLCDRIYPKITSNFDQVVRKWIYKIEAMYMKVRDLMEEKSQEKLTQISLEIIIQMQQVSQYFQNLCISEPTEPSVYSEPEIVSIVEALVHMKENLHPDFMSKSLDQQQDQDETEEGGDQIAFSEKLSSIFTDFIQQVTDMEKELSNSSEFIEQCKIFVQLLKIDEFVKLLNFNLEKVIARKDLLKLQENCGQGVPIMTSVQDFMISLIDLSSLNQLKRQFQEQLKEQFNLVIGYHLEHQSLLKNRNQIQEVAEAYNNIKGAEKILGNDFIIDNELNLQNTSENSQIYLETIIGEKLEELGDLNETLQSQLMNVKFDENLKQLRPFTMNKSSTTFESIYSLDSSAIFKILEILFFASQNFPTILSDDVYDEHKAEIDNSIQSILSLIHDFDDQIHENSTEGYYTCTLLKLTYLLCQYFPMKRDEIEKRFFHVVNEDLTDNNLKAMVAGSLQMLAGDIQVAQVAIKLGFKDWEVQDITKHSFINLSEAQDQLLNEYEFNQNLWQHQDLIQIIKHESLSKFDQIWLNDSLSFELYKMDLQLQQGIDKTNPEWGISQISNCIDNVVNLYYFWAKNQQRELTLTKLQLLSTASLLGFCRIPAEYAVFTQENDIFNQIEGANGVDDQSESHLQSTLFQMLPGQGITTSLQITALMLSLHGFQVTLIVDKPQTTRQAIEKIMNELECQIDIKTLEEVMQEKKFQVENQELIPKKINLEKNNRVLIAEQFDRIVDIAEFKTETFDLLKDADLDDTLNLLWKIKDLPFDQEYLRNEVSYLSLLDKCTQDQRIQLDKILSEILFDMRTCELTDSHCKTSPYREFFVHLKSKPVKQHVIKDFEIQFKISEIKNSELLSSHYGCILGTFSSQLNFEKEQSIKDLFKIKHIITLQDDSSNQRPIDEQIIKVDGPQELQSKIQQLIKQSDAAVLILQNVEEANELSKELKPHVKILNKEDSVCVMPQSILVITFEDLPNLLPLIRENKLRFFLKPGANLVLLRTWFFSEPYNQPYIYHHRLNSVLQGFNLQKYLVLIESQETEEHKNEDIRIRVQQDVNTKSSQRIERNLPRWTEDWTKISKINIILENPSQSFMNSELIATLKALVENAQLCFFKVAISQRIDSRVKLIQTGWESDLQSLQKSLSSLKLSQKAKSLPAAFDALVEHFRNVADQARHNLGRGSPLFQDTHIIIMYESESTNYEDDILSEMLQGDTYKIRVVKHVHDCQHEQVEESSLIDRIETSKEEVKNHQGETNSLLSKLAKSINFQLNNQTPGGPSQHMDHTPGGEHQTPGAPDLPSVIKQNDIIVQHQMFHMQQSNNQPDIHAFDYDDHEECNDFMAILARSSMESNQMKSPAKEMMRSSVPLPSPEMKVQSYYQEEEVKEGPVIRQVPQMMMGQERDMKIREINQNIQEIMQNTSRIGYEKYYFRNCKQLFELILEIVSFGIQEINLLTRDNAIICNIDQGLKIVKILGFEKDPNQIQIMILINQDNQIIQQTEALIREAIRTLEIQFEGK